MSVTESKTKTERKSSRKPSKEQETALSALLAQTEEVSVPLSSLIKSPLNVRTVPYSAESVSELADSIKGVGLLQNLVVPVSYTHLTLPTSSERCRSRWSPYH